MYYILSLLLICWGAAMVFAPQVWFEMTESWKTYSAAEPSKGYRIATRVIGGVNMIIGIVYIVVNLFF